MNSLQADWAIKHDWCVIAWEDLDGTWWVVVVDPVTNERIAFQFFELLCAWVDLHSLPTINQ